MIIGSDKFMNICEKAAIHMKRSESAYNHVAVLIIGNKIVSFGRNDMSRTCCNNRHSYSVHAEIDALSRGQYLLEPSGRPRKGRTGRLGRRNKAFLFSVRIGGCSNFAPSRPCNHCLEQMKAIYNLDIRVFYVCPDSNSWKQIRVDDAVPTYDTKSARRHKIEN